MTPILIPTRSAEDWKQLLARPDLHWKPRHSAMALAQSWEAARSTGFPPEVAQALWTAGRPDWVDLRLILAIPEYRVALAGGSRGSQTDLVALARAESGLVAIAVEGKVGESFGPTVREKRAEQSSGVDERLSSLEKSLHLPGACPDDVRYQLLHRTVSALHIAREFAADSAVMLVQSFHPGDAWFGDFEKFAALFGARPTKNSVVSIGNFDGTDLYIGWCSGDQQFLRGTEPSDPERHDSVDVQGTLRAKGYGQYLSERQALVRANGSPNIPLVFLLPRGPQELWAPVGTTLGAFDSPVRFLCNLFCELALTRVDQALVITPRIRLDGFLGSAFSEQSPWALLPAAGIWIRSESRVRVALRDLEEALSLWASLGYSCPPPVRNQMPTADSLHPFLPNGETPHMHIVHGFLQQAKQVLFGEGRPLE